MFLPALMATLIPALVLLGIAYVLRPKAEVVVPKIPNQKFQAHIYVSSSWGQEKIEPYKRTVREDPADPNPIYDGLELLMRESEARLEASLKANKILFELGQRAQLQLTS